LRRPQQAVDVGGTDSERPGGTDPVGGKLTIPDPAPHRVRRYSKPPRRLLHVEQPRTSSAFIGIAYAECTARGGHRSIIRPVREAKLTLDDARRLPRYRQLVERAQLHAEQARVFREAVEAAIAEGRDIAIPKRTVPYGTPAELRGVPFVGVRGASGAIRGTQPGSNLRP
jgi:hypothetical protein